MHVEVIACHISVTFWDTVWNWNARAFRYNFFVRACLEVDDLHGPEETFCTFTVTYLLLPKKLYLILTAVNFKEYVLLYAFPCSFFTAAAVITRCASRKFLSLTK